MTSKRVWETYLSVGLVARECVGRLPEDRRERRSDEKKRAARRNHYRRRRSKSTVSREGVMNALVGGRKRCRDRDLSSVGSQLRAAPENPSDSGRPFPVGACLI